MRFEHLSANSITTGTLTTNSSGTHTGTVSNSSSYLSGNYRQASINGSATSLNANSSAFSFDYGSNTFEAQGRIAANPNGNRHSLEQNGLTLMNGSGWFKASYSNGFAIGCSGLLNLQGSPIQAGGYPLIRASDGTWKWKE